MRFVIVLINEHDDDDDNDDYYNIEVRINIWRIFSDWQSRSFFACLSSF